MVRNLAVAAAVIGACAFITPSFAKGGGFMGGFHARGHHAVAPTQRARPPLYTGLAPNFIATPRGLFGRHFVADRRFHRHQRHAPGLGNMAAAIAAPVVYEVPQYEEPAPGAVALWRGNATGVCNMETVQVRGAKGMDEVTIIRC